MDNDRSLTLTALPAGSDIENYISELYGRASRSGVLLSNITSGEKNSATDSFVCGSIVNSVVSAPAAETAAASEISGTSKAGNAPIAGKAPAVAQSCVNAISVKLTVSGNWDQIVNFFKYLEDTNRIANITSVDMKSGQQSKSDQQSPGDLISVSADLSVFYKEKSEAGSASTVSGLASGNGFEESVIKKLNEVVFTPYVAPVVSGSGERNIFK